MLSVAGAISAKIHSLYIEKAVHLQFVHASAKALKALIRRDKQAHVAAIAEKARSYGQSDLSHLVKPLRAGGGKKVSPILQPLPMMLGNDGCYDESAEQRADSWLDHVSDLQAGFVVQPDALFRDIVRRQKSVFRFFRQGRPVEARFCAGP